MTKVKTKTIHIKKIDHQLSDFVPVVKQAYPKNLQGSDKIKAIKKWLKSDGKGIDPEPDQPLVDSADANSKNVPLVQVFDL